MVNLLKGERRFILKLIEAEEYRLNVANNFRKKLDMDCKDIDKKTRSLKRIKLKIIRSE